jgi:CubicO group peptidase (beta-lactamase class C family)
MGNDNSTDPRLEAALKESLRRGEHGFQVAAYLGEELIVAAHAGSVSCGNGRPLDNSTLFPIFSVTKAIAITAVQVQAERGLIDVDLPVARYWPEFGVRGKHRMTVRDVLSHRSGMPQMPIGVTPELMYNWEWMVERIARQRPWFEPGTKNAYQTLVHGWLLGELVRRTDPKHRPVSQFIQDEICKPLAIEDFYVGLPEAALGRVATLSAPWEPQPNEDHLNEMSMPFAVSAAPPVHNRQATWKACLPGSGGIANARSVARLFAMLANKGRLNGVQLLSPARVEACTQPRDNVYEPDEVYGFVCYVGVGGYWVGGDLPPVIPTDGSNPRILHHTGAGGSTGWADLDTGLAVAFCHDRMLPLEPVTPEQHPFWPVAQAVRAIAAEKGVARKPR